RPAARVGYPSLAEWRRQPGGRDRADPPGRLRGQDSRAGEGVRRAIERRSQLGPLLAAWPRPGRHGVRLAPEGACLRAGVCDLDPLARPPTTGYSVGQLFENAMM